MLKQYIPLKSAQVRGGAITAKDAALLKLGQFSMVQNVTPTHPGFDKRRGQTPLNSNGAKDSTNYAVTIQQNIRDTYPFTTRCYVQMSDGDILVMDKQPPEVNTNGSSYLTEKYSGNATPDPASWSKLNDTVIVSTGVDQHLLGPGSATAYPSMVLNLSAALTGALAAAARVTVPGGVDCTADLTDGSTATTISLGLWKSGSGCLYLCSDFPINSINITIQSASTNPLSISDAVLDVKHYTGTGEWSSVTSLVDSTVTSSVPLKVTGSLSWATSDAASEVKRYMFGKMAYWYRVQVSYTPPYGNPTGWTDATISAITVSFPSEFVTLKAVWDGVITPLSEVVVYNDTATAYDTYSGASVDLADATTSFAFYFYSVDPLEGLYFDVGNTPNENSVTQSVYYWNGSAWTALTYAYDETNGLKNSGWLIWERVTQHPTHIVQSSLFGYWYKITVSNTLSADTLVSVSGMPYYNITEWGSYGQASTVWKNRALYSFDKYPEYLYFSAADQPDCLVGTDTAVLEMGDGRPHKIMAIKPFFNNLLVFQQEKGEIGGCITMIQGYAPENFGKLVLSTKVGAMNANAVDVIENVYLATSTDEKLRTVAFFLSRYGVGFCDGTAIGFVSDDISDYFDPANTSICIRKGYENRMWLKHDPIFGLLRVGLICGTSATTPNVFPVYDYQDRCWYFDVRSPNLSCFANVALCATTEYTDPNTFTTRGPIVQVGGGVADGTIYLLNSGLCDYPQSSGTLVATSIDTYIKAELSGEGDYLAMLQLMIQCKAQSATFYTYLYQNGNLIHTLSLDSTAEVTSEIMRRNLLSLDLIGQHLAVKIQHTATTTDFSLYSVGLELKKWENR